VVSLEQSPNGVTEKPVRECAISVAPLGLWSIKTRVPGPSGPG